MNRAIFILSSDSCVDNIDYDNNMTNIDILIVTIDNETEKQA